MSQLKLKVCGMRSPENISEIASLSPDYMGFIFWDKSKRFVGKDFDPVHLNLLNPETKATGVFVNEFIPRLLDRVDYYHLDALQLHGEESPEYCRKVHKVLPHVEIIKAVAVAPNDTAFDFSLLKEYTDTVSYFLFDTKGVNGGGNGVTFDWSILAQYPYSTPFFLSGGITAELLSRVRAFTQQVPQCIGVDINSRFETEPGVKSPPLVGEFSEGLRGA